MRTIIAFAAALGITIVCLAQEAPKKINKVPIEYTSPGSGPEMFRSYCAPCHGPDGKGDGPAASALKKAPANLSLLTKHNNGKFPTLEVQNTIKGDSSFGAHGSRDMPMWGDLFRSIGPGGDGAVQIRIRVLRDYIETLQDK